VVSRCLTVLLLLFTNRPQGVLRGPHLDLESEEAHAHSAGYVTQIRDVNTRCWRHQRRGRSYWNRSSATTR